ncbi:hypothetical protein CS022_04235 [Veronia nyctiphanis]|uniref:Uncharacterized protein n=1 Tax=Veronia nyctiphanis TaxID=1278244 RepID=A0A4Q0YVM5_9GAMM|nr:hypothetical protein [Veronia nyctiphanis]RXJ74274.1 hypothetical protein CS022_04235 [Veronia nyctiphanis]
MQQLGLFLTLLVFIVACRSDTPTMVDPSFQHEKSERYIVDDNNLSAFAYLSYTGKGEVRLDVNVVPETKLGTDASEPKMTDKIFLSVDGVISQLNKTETQGYTSYHKILDPNSTQYELYIVRNGARVQSGSISILPVPFDVKAALSDNVISIEWPIEAEHQYEFDRKLLNCVDKAKRDKRFESRPDVGKNEHLVNSGRMHIVISDFIREFQFVALSELRARYEWCEFNVSISALRPDVYDLDSNIDFLVRQVREIRVPLW